MNIKRIAIVALIIGVVLIAIGALLPIFSIQYRIMHNGPISIIGATDAPGFWFLYQTHLPGWPCCLIALGIAIVLSAVLCLLCYSTVCEHLTVRTSAPALAISAALGLFLSCTEYWRMMRLTVNSAYPLSFPMSIPLGIAAAVIFLALCVWYGFCRKKVWSAKGLIMEIVIALLYMPTGYLVFSYLCDMLFR